MMETSDGAGCIFCKIVRGEIPCEKIYEDDETFAFLDIRPTTPGHTLVIPKQHAENIFDVSDASLTSVMRTVRKLSPIVRDAVNARGVHVNSNHGEAAGQLVFHLHMHIIPRRSRADFAFWPQHDYPDAETPNAIAEKMRAALG